MVKKSVIVAGAMGLLLALFNTTTLRSYVATLWDKGKEAAQDAESITFKLDRAKRMIKDLVPEIEKNYVRIAKEEIEVDKLRKQLDGAEQKLSQAKKDIDRLTVDLKRGDSTYVYARVSYSKEQVETDLSRRFDRFKSQRGTADKLRQILAAREQGLNAAQAKLEEMQAAKGQLEIDVAQLEARLKMVEVAQTASKLNVDNSRLSSTRELLEDISSRIDVAEKLVNVNTKGVSEIALDEKESKNILDEIADYFGENKDHGLVKLD